MTTSRGPSFSSTSSKSRATCARSCASHANADAPVSAHKPLSFSGLRAASATDNPDCARSRASDALRPSPAPTISAVLYGGVIQALPDDVVLRDNCFAGMAIAPPICISLLPPCPMHCASLERAEYQVEPVTQRCHDEHADQHDVGLDEVCCRKRHPRDAVAGGDHLGPNQHRHADANRNP